jgi:phosphofructokinase-like protein
MKIGVLTGGGDCPGLNAVIRAIVKTAAAKYNGEAVGIEEGFEGLMTPMQTRVMTPWTIRGILNAGGTILGTTNSADPTRFRRVEGGKSEEVDLSGMVLENVKELGLSGLVVIGGDGSLTIAQKLYEIGVPVVGVPKTIDNDISATDLTFGFHSAVTTATEALDKLHTTAESHHRVIVVEVMGRYVGWIAIESGIAGGADVILIPEIPYDIGKVCEKIKFRYEQGSRFSIVVVAEGAMPVGGEASVLKKSKEGYWIRLGGIGNKVGEELAHGTQMDVRVTVLGHIQRGGSPTPFDRILATRFGVAAADLVAEGKFGRMVCLRGQRIEDVPLTEGIKELKSVPPNGEMVRAAESLGISFGR